ncbi:O-antigen ligase family protein [Enterococcus sp. DIV0756]|uniref:O-antigen ligase family protein n=1 Tax=Enterococcus sp. DIV0756 TaxID=2774636 RepID=UPI003F25F47C
MLENQIEGTKGSDKSLILSFIWIIFSVLYVLFINTINIFPSIYYIFSSILLFVFILGIIVSTKINISLSFGKFFWIMYSIVIIMGSFFSINQELSIKYLLSYLPLVVLMIFSENIPIQIFNFIVPSMVICTGVHVFMNLFFLIQPEKQINILMKLYTGKELMNAVNQTRASFLVGITSDIGQNAFHISLFMICMFALLLTKTNKIVSIISFLFGLVLLIGTTKRGLMAGLFASMIVIILIRSRKNIKRFFVYSVLLIFFILVGWYILNNLEITQVMIKKNIDYSGNILNGRQYIYASTLNAFNQHPFRGIGVNTTQIVSSGNDAHNIYLQVLAESGVVGFILFVTAITCGLVQGIKELLKAEKSKYETIIIFSVSYQVFFVVYGMSGNPFYNNSLLATYILCLMIVHIFKKKKDEDCSYD